MVHLKKWQLVILLIPPLAVVAFLMISAGRQINNWGINWIWGIFILICVGWRWLLVQWSRPTVAQMEEVEDHAKTLIIVTEANIQSIDIDTVMSFHNKGLPQQK